MSMGEKLMEFLARSKAAGSAGMGVAREVPGMIRANPLKSAAGSGALGTGAGLMGGAMGGGGDDMEEDPAMLDEEQAEKDMMLKKFLAMHGG